MCQEHLNRTGFSAIPVLTPCDFETVAGATLRRVTIALHFISLLPGDGLENQQTGAVQPKSARAGESTVCSFEVANWKSGVDQRSANSVSSTIDLSTPTIIPLFRACCPFVSAPRASAYCH